MRLWHVIVVIGILFAIGGCRSGPIFDRADESVERALERVDRSVVTATERLDTFVAEARTALGASVKDLREQYEGAIKSTGVEVDRLREEFKGDIDDLDARMQQRLEQIRSSAMELVSTSDKAVQARIDQLFTELRRFMSDTLAQMKDLIKPVLDVSTSVSTAVMSGNKLIETVTVKFTEVMVHVQALIMEVKVFVLKIQGKDAEGNKTGSDWGALLGLLGAGIAAVVGPWLKGKINAVKAQADKVEQHAEKIEEKRATEKVEEGLRWKPEEIHAEIRQKVGDFIKSGEFDDELVGRVTNGGFDDVLRARLVHLGVLQVQASPVVVPVPATGGGDQSSPQATSGPTSSTS